MIRIYNDKNTLCTLSYKGTNKNYTYFNIRGLVTAQSKQVYRPQIDTKERIQSYKFYGLIKPGKP